MEAIQESMSQMSQMFHEKLAAFEQRQQMITKTAPPSPCESNLAAEFAVFKAFTVNALKTLQSQVALLAQQSDNLEMHTRRKILLLHGVPEDKKENMASLIVNIVSQKLKLGDFSESDVSRCHRMGGTPTPNHPRPILFKVRDVQIRAKIWAAKSCLKGSGITLSEFLTKGRHDTFMAARQRFGVAKCWTRDGSIFVLGEDGVRRRVSCITELDKISVPAKPAPAAATTSGAADKTSTGRSRRTPKLK